MSYAQFRLDGALLKALKQLKEESPNPTQKQVLKSISAGGDLIISSPLKENAELAAVVMTLNQCIKESAWTGTKILYLTSDQKRVEKALKWLSELSSAIEEFTVEGFDSPDSEGYETENLKKLSKGSTLVISTPEALVPLVEKQDMVFRGLKMLLVENGTKLSDFTLLERLFPRLMGGVQTVVQLSRPSETLLSQYKNLLGDPAFVEAKSTTEKTDPKAKKTKKEVHDDPVKESDGEKTSHVKRSTLEASKKSDPVKKEASTKSSETPVEKNENPSKDDSNATSAPADTTSATADTASAPADSESGASIEAPLDIPGLLESLKEVSFKTVTIPDQTQIEAFTRLFDQQKEKKTLVYVIGSYEADSIFKELRKKDTGLVSVHSKLRRNTYEYRMSRFFSGELSLAVIGGNLKTAERPEGVERVIFTNPPKSSEQFFRKLSRVGFSAQEPEVLMLIQSSQESEFLKWAIQTGIKFTPVDDASFRDLKPVERKRFEQPKQSEEPKRSGDRERSKPDEKRHSKNSGTSGSHPSTVKTEDARQRQERSDRQDRSQERSDRRDRQQDRSRQSSRGKGQQRADRNRNHRGRPERGESSYRGKDQRSDQRRRPEEPKKSTPYGLPAASYDRLERGRSGKKESKGLLGAIKKLFGGD